MDILLKKPERQDLIREILKEARIETQTDLVNALRSRGYDCTQATVSRDIREMKLTKRLSDDGEYYYVDPSLGGQPVVGKLLSAFSSGVVGVEYSGNIVVVKTVVSMAPSCALAIDAGQWQEVVGTLAGDDTIMVVTKSASASRKLIKKLESLLGTVGE